MGAERFGSVDSLVKKKDSIEAKKEKTAIVEVGAHIAPLLGFVPEDFAQAFNADPSLHFFAIDINEREVRRGRENAEASTMGLKERVHFVQAQGQELPFADASVAEVIFRNVMGRSIDIPHLLLQEAARVLKANGVLKIIETYAPFEARDAIHYLEHGLKDVFQRVDADNAATPIDERSFDESIMGNPVGAPRADRLILYFKKKKSPDVPRSEEG